MKHFRVNPLKTYFGALEAECIADDAEVEEYISIYEHTHRREHFQRELDDLKAHNQALSDLAASLNGTKR